MTWPRFLRPSQCIPSSIGVQADVARPWACLSCTSLRPQSLPPSLLPLPCTYTRRKYIAPALAKPPADHRQRKDRFPSANRQEAMMATHAGPLQQLARDLPGPLPSRFWEKEAIGHQLSRSAVKIQTGSRLPPQCKIPRGAWDSHMHVIDDKYALAADAVYRPSPHTVEEALDFETSVGIGNMVLVQPSIYGHDNSCLLDALKTIGPRHARGVVSFDPEQTTQDQLQHWHTMGVRGVRLNISSNGRAVDFEDLKSLLRRYADAVRALNWVVQIYIPMALIEPLERIVPALNVRFCIDHLGHPELESSLSATQDPYKLPGFASLARLLKSGHVFVKLSAPYRLSRMNDQRDLEPVAKEILRLGGKHRVVFATDWPHTRFEGLDIRPWIDKVLEWCNGDETLVDRLFRGNAEDLWSVTRHE